MRTGLPSGSRSIVTRDASSWHNPQMLEYSTGPSHRSVATIAGQVCRDVRYRLPLGRDVVVTLQATSGDDPVMGKKGRHPIRSTVTTVAIKCSWQMCRWLKC